MMSLWRFDPLIAPWLLAALAGLAALLLALALWRRLPGAPWRLLALVALLLALAQPIRQVETRVPRPDVVLALVDESDSQSLGTRPAQTSAALSALKAALAQMPGVELRLQSVKSGAAEVAEGGTALHAALAEALADIPPGQLAAVIALTDGQVHDTALPLPPFAAPFHLLLTGRAEEWDRRLILKSAPAFAIVGEEIRLSLRIEDQGVRPKGVPPEADLTLALDGGEPRTFRVPVGEDLTLPLTLTHRGVNLLHVKHSGVEGELTERNNAAALSINGVRERLRVLLVSGEPHAGERVWRNLLKSDASVDLVHFTILRPPEKQDGVPVEELALIAFPTRELFVEKLKEFDLIIFDRYRLRGILPVEYLENVRDYVREGGTVLVAAGPEFGSSDSLYRSPLGEVLPVETEGRILRGGFAPRLTALGTRHPVTQGLEALAPEGGWGRWFRQVAMTARPGGQVVMEGLDGAPLLVLAREGEGRVAVLGSDQAWLWGRGYEGGGPLLELLRRLAHWMLKEPELEEEVLRLEAKGGQLNVLFRSLTETAPGPVRITGPDGSVRDLVLQDEAPGLFTTEWPNPSDGLYRAEVAGRTAVAVVGPAAPKEFADVLATPAALQPLVDAQGGGVFALADGLPDLRRLREGAGQAAGRGWMGIRTRGAYDVTDLRQNPVLPAVAWLALAALLALAAWLWEARRP